MSNFIEEITKKLDPLSAKCVKVTYDIMEKSGKIFEYDEMLDKFYVMVPGFRTDKVFHVAYHGAYKIALNAYCNQKNISVPAFGSDPDKVSEMFPEIQQIVKEKTPHLNEFARRFVDLSFIYMKKNNREMTYYEILKEFYSFNPEFETNNLFLGMIEYCFEIALKIFREEKASDLIYVD